MSCGYCNATKLTAACPICGSVSQLERAAAPAVAAAAVTLPAVVVPFGGQHRAAPVDEPRDERWRTGTKVFRTLYNVETGALIGMMDTPALAALAAQAPALLTERDALRAELAKCVEAIEITHRATGSAARAIRDNAPSCAADAKALDDAFAVSNAALASARAVLKGTP